MALQTSQIFIVILVACMSHSIMARTSYIRLIPRQDQPFLVGEADNYDEFYPEPRKLSEVDPNFQARWPWQRDIYATDYEDSPSKNLIEDRQYVPRQDPIPTPQPQSNSVRKNISKGHAQKKSNSWSEYMTPCHFKICNFGRKRNVMPF